MHYYKELNRGVGFQEYLKHVKGPSSSMFLIFHSSTHGLFEKLGRHAKEGGGSQECLNCAACKEFVEHFLLSGQHMIPRDKIICTI